MKKVATYCRASNHVNSDQSLTKQQERLAEYCAQKGYEVADTFRVAGNHATGLEMFLNCLQLSKEKGIGTIVTSSTNRIAGTAEEMAEIRKAYEASGITLETLDGSHLFPAPANLVANFSLMGDEDTVVYGLDDEAVELVFGYDVTSQGLLVNEGEAEVVRFVFNKIQEYTDNPPTELIQEVIDEHMSRGEIISENDAAREVPYGRITHFIENEIKDRWPDQFESMLSKQAHNQAIFQKRDSQVEPIIDREEWEKVQAMMAERHDDPGPQMGGMTM